MGATPFVILLPPSEGKASGGNARKPWSGESGLFGNALGIYRDEVARHLLAIKGGEQKLLGVKGVHLQQAQESNSSLIGAPTLPAWQRYTGVVWDHLDVASFSSAARSAAVKRIFVPSGLAGIVRADDPLPSYRLKMGAKLTPFGNLASWWRDDITDALLAHIKKSLVIDLLPNEHKTAFNWDNISNVVHVDLVSKKGAVVGGHNAKAAKGLLARHLLQSVTTPLSDSLRSFTHSEYFAKESS